MSEKQDVIVDHGDLLEVCQAAEAWAKHLRVRGGVVKQDEAADRIDQAISAVRRSALHHPVK
jgi:hypothetical protein